MKIFVVTPTLVLGGAERVALYQAAGFAAKGHDVTLLVTHKSDEFYSVPAGVKRIDAGLNNKKTFKDYFTPFKTIRALIKIFKQQQPDIVIINMFVSVAVAAQLTGTKFIFAEHSNLHLTQIDFLKKTIFEHAKKVVLLSKKEEKYAKKIVPKAKTTVIYNPVVKPQIINDVKPPFFGSGKNIVSVGRLSQQKGFDLLIKAWSLVEEKFPLWQLTIAGDGPERKHLVNLIKEFNLKRVVLAGAQRDVGAIYKYADLYVSPSRWETFNLALSEAMSWNTAAVSYECSGPDILIRDGVDGFLVTQGSITGLAEVMAMLMENDEKRALFSSRSSEVLERFTMQNFTDSYMKLISK